MRSLRLDRTTGRRSIALCTATKNRLWQLRHTLVTNLVAMWPHRSWVRYYIADFGSSDNTISFIMNTCQPFIRQGMLRVFTTTPQKSWKDESGEAWSWWSQEHDSVDELAIAAEAALAMEAAAGGGPEFAIPHIRLPRFIGHQPKMGRPMPHRTKRLRFLY